MAELLGKATGCSKGKGGSMHFFDAEKGFLGGHAIVGSHIPLAAGVAFAIKYRGEDRVCICYFGDGAMNQGVAPRGLQHGRASGSCRSSTSSRTTCMRWAPQLAPPLVRCIDLTVRGGTAYGIPGVSINGNDIELMAQTTREAANRARAGEGPTFIEAKTYRFSGHSMSDPAKYRTKEELEKATGARPDRRSTRTSSRSAAGSTTRRSKQMHEEVKARDRGGIDFAEQSDRAAARGALRRHHRGPVHPAGVIDHGRHCIPRSPRTRR